MLQNLKFSCEFKQRTSHACKACPLDDGGDRRSGGAPGAATRRGRAPPRRRDGAAKAAGAARRSVSGAYPLTCRRRNQGGRQTVRGGGPYPCARQRGRERRGGPTGGRPCPSAGSRRPGPGAGTATPGDQGEPPLPPRSQNVTAFRGEWGARRAWGRGSSRGKGHPAKRERHSLQPADKKPRREPEATTLQQGAGRKRAPGERTPLTTEQRATEPEEQTACADAGSEADAAPIIAQDPTHSSQRGWRPATGARGDTRDATPRAEAGGADGLELCFLLSHSLSLSLCLSLRRRTEGFDGLPLGQDRPSAPEAVSGEIPNCSLTAAVDLAYNGLGVGKLGSLWMRGNHCEVRWPSGTAASTLPALRSTEPFKRIIS